MISPGKSFERRLLSITLAIPLINAIATLTVNYFEAGTLNPGTIRAALIVLFISLNIRTFYKWNRINKVIALYLLLVFFLSLLSSNIQFSLYNYLKLFIALMMFPIGQYFFKSFPDLLKLNSIIIFSLSLYTINLVISNIFDLGSSDYLADSVYFGSGRVNIAKSAALMILTTPLFFTYYRPGKKILYLLSILIVFGAIVLVILAVKRSALLALAAGIVLYLLFSPQKMKNLRFLLIIGTLGISTSGLFIDQIRARFQAREERFEFTDPEFQEGENRVREFHMVTEDMKKRDPFRFLFGTELFNDREYYGTRRMLHTDYMTFLHGTGVIGFSWFYTIYVLIFMNILTLSKKIKENWSKTLLASTLAILFGSLILSIAGTIYTVDILSLTFLYTGAITGVLKTYIYNQKFIANYIYPTLHPH